MSDESENKEDGSSEISGRKVFFLHPTGSVQNQVITELIQNEIEVYVAKDHNRLPRVLKNYPDSVVYVNIDDPQLTEPDWEKWIVNNLIVLKTILIGIFSGSTDEELIEKYKTKLNVTCGFIKQKVDMSKTAPKVLEFLDKANVKGRRKYLRATVDADTNATLNMPVDGDFKNAIVRDVSVVGISCVFEQDPGLKKNTLFKDIQIRLQSNLIKVEAIVFGSREENGQQLYVFLFTQRINPEVRTKIRKFIQHSLQTKMDQELN